MPVSWQKKNDLFRHGGSLSSKNLELDQTPLCMLSLWRKQTRILLRGGYRERDFAHASDTLALSQKFAGTVGSSVIGF
jgi:hypothetical protein